MAKKLPYMIAIILICVAPMADTYIIIPAMTDIGNAFPEAGLTKLNLILTISSLFVIPSSLIAGKLVESGRISKKKCLMLGFILFTIGGASGSLIVDINFLLFTRAILGIGNGLATAMVVTITADYFTEKEGATVMGLYSAIGGLIAIGLTILSGYLVLLNWRYAFAVYLVCILIIIYHGFVLKKNESKETGSDQEIRAAEKPAEETAMAPPSKPALGKAVWVLIVITILSQTFGNSLYLALSQFIESEKIGDAASTGMANGALTAAIVAVSLLFSWVYSKLHKNTSILFFILMAAGFFLLSRSYSFTTALISLIIWGVGFGLTIPYVMQEAIVCPPRQLITFTGSLVNSCIFLSYVLSTFVHPVIGSISGDEGTRNFFNIVSLILLACGAICFFLILATRHKGPQAVEEQIVTN